MASSGIVTARREGRVEILTFASAPKVNPLTVPLQQELLAALAVAAADADVGALVLTGSGRSLCVGADLSGMLAGGGSRPMDSVDQRTADMLVTASNPLVLALRQFPVPVVTAINGAAAGAGVGLALSADFTLGAESAFFSLPFMPNLGIVPDMGSSWYLTRRLGASAAATLMLTGERVSMADAQRRGLIYRCVPDADLMAQALALAEQLARLPSHAAPEIRALVDAAGNCSLAEQLQGEADRQRVLIDGPAFAEGARAFMEKRPPVLGSTRFQCKK